MGLEKVIPVEYEKPDSESDGAVCSTKHAWARVPPEPTPGERAALKDKIASGEDARGEWRQTAALQPGVKGGGIVTDGLDVMHRNQNPENGTGWGPL